MFIVLLRHIALCTLFVSICAGSKPKFLFTKEDNGIIKVYEGYPGDDDWIARGSFDNQINSTGFSYLELETNSKFNNLKQALHVGYLEGQLTSDLIYSRWFNVVQDFCINNEDNCSLIDRFVKRNARWIRKELKHLTDPYWHQVKLFYTQIGGIYRGYNNKTDNQHLKWRDILWLNLMTEIPDVQNALTKKPQTSVTVSDNDHCSALIKIMPSNEDVYFGHNTWGDYREMLRVMKKYILRYTKSETEKDIIPGSSLTTTSYPGVILSVDDFYLISSGLAVMETTNSMYNRKLLKYITPINMVWEGIRSTVANRLATDGESWNNVFKQYNSGTYNNQWMVFDYKKFKPGSKLSNGALWVIEQMPSLITAKDLTGELNSAGYWSSYNVPYFENIFKISGYESMVKTNGTWYSHEDTPRAKIFKRDQDKVKDMDSFMTLMRSNDYTNDPFAACNCTPPYSAAGAIAARKDLNPFNGINENSRKPAGATDAKITNSKLFLKLTFVAVSGPTTGTGGRLPIFKWSTSNFTNVRHVSLPDEFNFQPVLHKWTFPLN